MNKSQQTVLAMIFFILAVLGTTGSAKAKGYDSGWSDSYTPSITWKIGAPAQYYDDFICNKLSRGHVWLSNSTGGFWVSGMLCFRLTTGERFRGRVTTKPLRQSGTVTNTVCLYRYGMIRDNCIVLKVRLGD